MNKGVIIFVLLMLHVGVSYSQVDYDSCNLKISKQQLLNELSQYSKYWKNDSLANNGFRYFIGREFLRCSGNGLKGTAWSVLSDYLGKPHFTYTSSDNFSDEIRYRYVLYTYGDYKNYKDIGNTILDVITVAGIVKEVFVFDNDG